MRPSPMPSLSSSPWPPAGWDELSSLLPVSIREAVLRLPLPLLTELREVRIRAGRPLVGVFARGNRYLSPDGAPCRRPEEAHRVAEGEVRAFLLAITGSSVYAHERELREGFLTLPGGHRVGFSGQGLVEQGRLRSLRHIGGFNVRLAREVKGAARALLPRLLLPSGRPAHTLLVSPPGCGKTTLLRDLARALSYGEAGRGASAPCWPDPGGPSWSGAGAPSWSGPGWRVSLIDERSELAACREGIPLLDVGPNTDVLDGIPKAIAIPMALRALGPEVLMTDEVGGPEDWRALALAQRSGVAVVATAHAADGTAAAAAGAEHGLVWERLVLISDRRGPGTIEAVTVI